MSAGDSRDHQEQECKLELPDEQSYVRALALFGPPMRTILQVNHYFETADRRLAAAHMMLRVREDDETATVTLKSDASLSGATLRNREREARLPRRVWEETKAGKRNLAEATVPPVLAVLDTIGAEARLLEQGVLRNTRTVHPMAPGYTIELDRTTLPDDSVDFEIEVETDRPDEVLTDLGRLLENYGIAYRAQTRTKYQRFLAALGA